jgi:hypothetical protein
MKIGIFFYFRRPTHGKMGAPQVTIETITVTRPLKVQYRTTNENILYRTQYKNLCVLKLAANGRSGNSLQSCHLTLSTNMGGGWF